MTSQSAARGMDIVAAVYGVRGASMVPVVLGWPSARSLIVPDFFPFLLPPVSMSVSLESSHKLLVFGSLVASLGLGSLSCGVSMAAALALAQQHLLVLPPSFHPVASVVAEKNKGIEQQ